MNYSLLYHYAESLSHRIMANQPISLMMIEEKLDFLDPTDEIYTTKSSHNIKNNIFTKLEPMITNTHHKLMLECFSHCKKVYDDLDEIDPMKQTAVQMLLEAVLEQFEAHIALLNSVNPLLPKNDDKQLFDDNKTSKKPSFFRSAPKPKTLIAETSIIPEENRIEGDLKYDTRRKMFYFGNSLDES